MVLNPAARIRFRSRLLTWYDASRRDLPWRRTRDPYAIWVSEIMLQQTRVVAVLEHYRAFLNQFPNVSALAAASLDSVLAAWSGLGYYRRARMLHRCAHEIVSEYSGQFPTNAEALRELPGIGRYTAAAIASIAFNESIAVVDGNVERVLERLCGRTLTPTQTWSFAQSLISKPRPGDFNQAMMELGATICLPAKPDCVRCPVRRWCSTQGNITQTKTAIRRRKKDIWCTLERRNGSVKLVRRPKDTSLMAGMWELPRYANSQNQSSDEDNVRTFRHSITNTDYTVHVLLGNSQGKPFIHRGRWVPIDEIVRMPITGLTRKILKAEKIF